MLPSTKSNVWHLVLALLFTAASPLAESQSLEGKQMKKLGAEINAANQSGNYKLACEKAIQFHNIAQKAAMEKPAENWRSALKDVESMKDQTCQNAEDQQVGQFLGLVGRGYICKGYDSAVKTCAPASDFRACLSRLGFNSQAQKMCK